MSRRLAQHFRCRPLEELTRQLLVAPVEKRIEQVRRAEKLHDDLDPERLYPYDFVHFRITGYRSETEDAMLVGSAVVPDLRLLIDSLSRTVGMPVLADEPIVTPAELARQLNVSAKTIERWRKIGLRWRWAKVDRDQPPHLVLTREAVKRFQTREQQRIQRAANFSQLSDTDRGSIIAQARHLAEQPDMSLFKVAQQLAGQTGRAVETIRLLLEQHEHARPNQRLFSDYTGPLTARQKRMMIRSARIGESVKTIAEHNRRSVAAVRHVLRQRRAAVLRRLRISYVTTPTFTRDDADTVLLRSESSPDDTSTLPRGLDAAVLELPETLRPLYLPREIFNADRQRFLLVRMNYLKFKAAKERDKLDQHHPHATQMRNIESWIRQAAVIRHRLFMADLPRVLLIARQHLQSLSNVAPTRLVDLLEIGHDELALAIDTYDAGENESFETYLNWRLVRRFARYEPQTTRAHRRLTGEDMLVLLRRAASARALRLVQP